MNNNKIEKIEVISATKFIELLEGKWRFTRGTISPYTVIENGMVSSIVGGGKKVGPIKKVLIVPKYFEDQLGDKYFELLSNSIKTQELLEESDFLEDTSVLLVGECCGIDKNTVEILRGLFPPINFLAAPHPDTQTYTIGLNKQPLKEKAKLIAEGLRSLGLMQKQETIWH